jgi:hypothetical protein
MNLGVGLIFACINSLELPKKYEQGWQSALY